ncbi:MAG: hypothetical protein V7L23_34510 [Nostoc sp.]|uniref:hypothetical protein n=1 Tax=Nostoc sp. TaxID=1180 RepID=UPI002FEEA6E3
MNFEFRLAVLVVHQPESAGCGLGKVGRGRVYIIPLDLAFTLLSAEGFRISP